MAGPYFHLLHNDYFTQTATSLLGRATNPSNTFLHAIQTAFPHSLSQCSSLHRMYTSLDEQGVMKP